MAQNTRKGTSGQKSGSRSTTVKRRGNRTAANGSWTSGKRTRTSSSRSSASAGRRTSTSGRSSSRSTGARKTAAVERARREKLQREREIRMDIALVLIFLIMVFIYISLAGYGANVGSAVRMILFGIFGIGAWIVPLWVFILCFFLITQRGGRQMPMRLFAAALIILILQSADHLYLHTASRLSLDVPFHVKEAFHLCADNSFGGGIPGAWFARLLYRAFGLVGSWLVYLGMLVISLMLLIQRSPAGVIRNMRERREAAGIPGFSERREIRRRQRQQEREEAEEERELREAERILEREDRDAARAREREEREKSMENRRRRRGAGSTSSLDLEHTLLGNGSSKDDSRADSNTGYTGGKRRRSNGIRNMDRRRDVHEIHVITDVEEPLTVPAAGRGTEPEGTIYRRPSQTDAGVLASEDFSAQSHDYPSDGYAETIIDRQSSGRADNNTNNRNTGNDEYADSIGSYENPGNSMNPLNTDNSEEVSNTGNTGDYGANAGPEDPSNRLVPASARQGAEGQIVSAQSDGQRPGDNTFNPSEEDLQNITVHRETETDKAANRTSARTAAVRRGSNYVNPTFSLLEQGKSINNDETERELQETAYRLQETLRTFGVQVTITDISQGPSVTRYELNPDKGVKVSKIVNLSDDIKLRLAASDIRIEAPIPGKSAIGIEVPNKKRTTLHIRDLLASKEFRNFEGKVPFAVGKDIVGKNVIADIARMPHLLIAGATGSGKSVCINTIILSILYKSSPDKVRLLLIDPKVVELRVYEKIPHLIIPVVTDVRKASAALNWAVAEMDKRYNLFAAAGARDLEGYNAMAEEYRLENGEYDREPLPRIVIIVDELADLMMVAKNEVETAICRLAQLARAAGIHLIIATQRPSVDVITGLIKANMPSRIAFSVSSQVDSRTILDMAGAEKLIGQGDMLFYPQNYVKPARIQGAFVSDSEVSRVVKYIKENNVPQMHDEKIVQEIEDIEVNGVPGPSAKEVRSDPGRDEHFAEAGRFIIEKNKASIGLLQRVFKIGFNRAARIMDQLAEAGVVSEESSTRARQVLMTMPEFEEFLENGN